MKKTIAMLILGTAIFSGSTLANYVAIEVTPQKGDAWVIVDKNKILIPDMDLVVTNGQKQHYTTTVKRLIPSSR